MDRIPGSKLMSFTKRKADARIFYGYVVILASALILVLLHGTNASFGVFVNPLQQEFGWNRATISGANSLAFFLMGLFSIASGRLTDRFGPRLIMVLGGLITGLGYFLASRVNSVPELYLFYAVTVGIGTSCGDVTLMSTAARWFSKRRGLMTSLVKVGTGTGMFIVPSVASWLILGFGWRTAWLVLAVAGAVWTISISQFLRRDPRQMDLEPYGTAAANHASPAATETGLTLGEVMRTRQFWMVCGAYFIIWYSTQSVMLHIAAHGVDTGLSLTQAAGTVSIIGAASIAGRLTMGVAGDRVGNRRALVYCLSVLVVALVWLQFTEGLWMLWLFALIYGFAHGGFFAIVSPLVAELFGTKAHGANLGMVLFVGQTGGALGPIVTGRIFDVNHNYSLAFLILVIATAAGLIVASLLRPVGNKKI